MYQPQLTLICLKHKIPKQDYVDFSLLISHNMVSDEQFDIRLRTVDNYKACLRELCETAFGVALSYLDGIND